MKMMTIRAMATILLAFPFASFSATDTAARERFIIAAREAPRVELYIADWCPNCRKAMDFFRARGIDCVVYDVEKDEAAARRKKRLDKRRLVPFAIINEKKISGYSEEEYLKALGSK